MTRLIQLRCSLLALCLVGFAGLGAVSAIASRVDPASIAVVHLVQSCHLDVGFINSSTVIVNEWFDYLADAARVANELKQEPNSSARLRFMTHSYLVSLFFDCPPNMGLNCPGQDAQTLVGTALKQGDIYFHAFPFNGEAELLNGAMLDTTLASTRGLAESFGVAPPAFLSQRDVPGLARSAIPHLKAAGISAVTVGVNEASMPPAVPSLFVWQDPVSSEWLFGSWHPRGYGGGEVTDCILFEGLNHTLCPLWRDDNSGPPGVDEVKVNFAIKHAQFPNAQVIASTYDDFFAAVESSGVLGSLPRVTTEIGDTWIHGCPSDPYKMAAFRAIQRQFDACLSSGACSLADPVIANFSRLVIKNEEHTWGKDVKTWLGDWTNWANSQFHAQLSPEPAQNYRAMIDSWTEQRRWGLDIPLQSLGSHPLAASIVSELAALVPPPNGPDLSGFVRVSPAGPFECGALTLGFDPTTGAIASLVDTRFNTPWASASNPVGQFLYQSFTETDFASFLSEYLDEQPAPSWALKDFGKLNLSSANPVRQNILPQLVAAYQSQSGTQFLLELSLPPSAVSEYGAPAALWVAVDVDGASGTPHINLTVTLYNKTATRIPEALWVRFSPITADPAQSWRMHKISEWQTLADVAVNGSRHMHGLWDGVLNFNDESSSYLTVSSLDAGVACLGQPNPFPVPDGAPDLSQGVAFNLFNNIWGTNYIMWYPFLPEDANSLFRFRIGFDSPFPPGANRDTRPTPALSRR